MTLRFSRIAALALSCFAVGTCAAFAQSDGAGGVSGGSATGGVGWTPTPADGGATDGSDKDNKGPASRGADRPSSGAGPDAGRGAYSAGEGAAAAGGEERKAPR